MHTVWTHFIYDPIYNALVWIAQHITGQDVGLAVVLLTIGIRLVLFPLSKKSILSQYKTRALEPKLAAIKAKGLSKEEEAKETFALYKIRDKPFFWLFVSSYTTPYSFCTIFCFYERYYPTRSSVFIS